LYDYILTLPEAVDDRLIYEEYAASNFSEEGDFNVEEIFDHSAWVFPAPAVNNYAELVVSFHKFALRQSSIVGSLAVKLVI